MARARNIKPGLYKNEDLAECSVWARYIFPGLWTLADREGRMEDRPKRIKGELLPYDTQDVEPLLRELASKTDEQGDPFILRYQNEDGRFIQITKFHVHQSPHYSEKASVIKPPPLRESKPDIQSPVSEKTKPIKRVSQPPDSLIHRFSDSPTADSPTPDSPNPESWKHLSAHPQADGAHEDAAYPAEFEAAWRRYPKRSGGNPKHKALQAWNARLKEGATPEEIGAGVERYAEFIRQSGKEHTEFVQQAATFFGPNRAFCEPWAKPNGSSHQAAIDEAERRIFGGPQERDITDEASRL